MRITKAMKDQIIAGLMRHAYAARKAALDVTERDLGDSVYDDVYSPEVRQRMRGFPNGYFSVSDSIRARFGEHMIGVLRMGKSQRIARIHRANAAKEYGQAHPFTVRFLDWRQQSEDLLNEEHTSRSGIWQVLNSAATLAELTEIWPEVRPFAKDFMTVTPITPGSLENLNQSLRLVPERLPTRRLKR